jgi:ABC-type multidrug transport system fused ATPase/permease subunit
MIRYLSNNWFIRANKMGLNNNSIVLLVLFPLISTITELFGIGIFLPIFQFIKLGGNLDLLTSDSIIWQYIVNIFAYFNMTPSLLVMLLMSFGLFIVRQLFNYLRMIYTTAVTQKITQIQRNHLFDNYIGACTSYHDRTPVGNLVNIVMTEVRSAVSGIMAPMRLMVYVIMFIGYFSILLMLSWEMTIAVIIVLYIASIAPNKWIKQTKVTGRRLVSSNTLMSEFLVGRLKSPSLVRLAGTEDAEKEEFRRLTLSQRKNQVLQGILRAKTTVAIEPIIIGLSLSFLYFSHTTFHLDIEVIGFYLIIVLRLMPIMQGVVQQYQGLQASMGAIEIFEDRINSMKESMEKDTGSIDLCKLNQSILLSGVYYLYPDMQNYVLENITINFKVNSLTAIVGPSGSGKSTLIDLLPRLRLPTKGLIYIDNKNYTKYKLKSIRKMISYVPQEPQMFNGTVRSHILYGKADASNDEVVMAANLAGAEEFISKLPQGFDTNLGEDAVKLSGGQKQRLDLARALVRKAPILILDEPTSNLDAESEAIFSKVISRIRDNTNTTIIIVSHRLESISDADNIIVLNHGKVESSGVHVELLRENGWYAKAWNSK